ncbi:hypothetical protein VE03_03725 [Pseudogymnoascus sp. 23342-1-I1]|nr:hypothetical protein VE03_03725 [Pseudogymnoascus sp. 23342-1-I1]
MAGLFSKFKTGSGPSTPGPNSKESKKQEPVVELTPLEKMLLNAGPIRPDGSDKFFGMENFGNTCYCNSIVQALYYSIPFREHVLQYPPHSPHDTPNANPKPVITSSMNGGAVHSQTAKGLSAAEAAKRRATVAATPPPQPPPGQVRPEDKPDSPEYKKKQAMLAGPIVDLTYENARQYGMEESTFTALKDIFTTLIQSQTRMGILSPQRFLEIFKRDNEMFRTTMHQDAHEFYGILLNAVITNVEENARRLRELEPPKNEEALGDGMMSAFANAASAMGLSSGAQSPGTGWVHDIFEGVLTSETRCLTCEASSQRDETFIDLSIDLEEHSSVTSCLRKFSAEEMLCERNKFHCDNCGGLQEAEKRMKIKRLPKILTLHLKRFKYTEDLTRLQKLFHRVVYPYHLRMFNTTDDAEDPDRLYELYAVVVHIGGNAYHGHYISIIKTQDRGWLLFDDEMVEPVDKHYVRNFFGDKPGMACAYVLFYQETTIEAVRKEQEAEGVAEVAIATEEAGIPTTQPHTPGAANAGLISRQMTLPPTLLKDEHLPPLAQAVTNPTLSTSPEMHPAIPETIAQSLPSQFEAPAPKKADRAAAKKESKEAEKARKHAEKEKAKADERQRKEVEQKRKEAQRTQAEALKNAVNASKISAAEDEEKRRREAAVAGAAANGQATAAGADGNGNGSHSGNGKKENGFISGLTVNRNKPGAKSMSRRSLGWLKSDSSSSSSAGRGGGGGDVAVDGETAVPVPTIPERLARPAKERFSFSLGRKKSNLTPGQ